MRTHAAINRAAPVIGIAWGGAGRAFGLKAMHTYVLEARDGGDVVRTEEAYDGLVARLFRTRLQRTLDGTLERGLRHLKAEAERRNAAPVE